MYICGCDNHGAWTCKFCAMCYYRCLLLLWFQQFSSLLLICWYRNVSSLKVILFFLMQAYTEKEDSKKLKQKQRERMQPKMGKMDIDYQVCQFLFISEVYICFFFVGIRTQYWFGGRFFMMHFQVSNKAKADCTW